MANGEATRHPAIRDPLFPRRNAVHNAIVDLEHAGKLLLLVTQNIDGLHARAGTSPERLVELHGTMAHERALGARVQDVHSPELALQAGLNTAWPGFDVLSHRPDGKRRCIEIKGRARLGNVHISTNEWAAAANRREEYWLYAVFECASASPRLVAVQDPFAKLVEKAAGFELEAADILAAGEQVVI